MKWKGFFTPDHKNSRKFYLDVKLHSYNAAGEKLDKMVSGTVYKKYIMYCIMYKEFFFLHYYFRISSTP